MIRVAVVGTGPAGFYASAALLAAEEPRVAVDAYDRLPTPYGLVRSGVAPDHPRIKAVTAQYERVAAHDRFRFFGHVDIGSEISRAELLERYHAVVWAYGAANDRRLGIPGEGLRGSHAATEFVAWYNGHPDCGALEFDLERARRVAIIGNGNVALDVARMLALDADELAITDVADHALRMLSQSAVSEILVIGRRGPAQAAFSGPELRELGNLARADIDIDPSELALDPASARWLEGHERRARIQNFEIMSELAQRPGGGKPVRIVLRFLRTPVAITGRDRVEGIRLERNELVALNDQAVQVRPAGGTEEVPVDLVFRAIGYVGFPIPGLPFDPARGVVRNVDGRVVGAHGGRMSGEYVAGWAKRGASGVIGTNKKCARATVAHLLEDVAEGRLTRPRHDDVESLIARRAPNAVSWRGWEAIDAAERAAGIPDGRPRRKLTVWEELRAVAGRA